MDANKLQVLHAVKFRIEPTCGVCVHFKPSAHHRGFGHCEKYTYKHLKHAVELGVSVNAAGRCEDGFQLHDFERAALGDFTQFLTKEAE